MTDYERAIDSLRIYAKNGGQAWLTAQECRALLVRLDSMTCDACGVVCSGEPVRRFCDGCVEVKDG